jgi:GT2 family glycosyltransferase
MKLKCPKVAIIIINWNGWRDTSECLESLYNINYTNYEVILVDNCSEDNSSQMIDLYCQGKMIVQSPYFNYSNLNKPIYILNLTKEQVENRKYHEREDLLKMKHNKKLTFIRNDRNYGFAEGNNIGIQYALDSIKPDFFLLLNNDTVVDSNFLIEMIKVAESDEKIGAVGPKIYVYGTDRLVHFGRKVNWYGLGFNLNSINSKNKIVSTETLLGACMLIKAKLIEQIGFLPTEYFLMGEDLDYSIRILNAGYINKCVSTAKIYHKSFRSFKKIKENAFEFAARSEVMFHKKYSTKLQFYSFLLYFISINGFQILIEAFKAKNINIFIYYLKGVKKGLSYN